MKTPASPWFATTVYLPPWTGRACSNSVAAAQKKLEAEVAAARGELKATVGAIAREIASQTLGRRVA